ncbi:hypothetical protein ACP275_06G055400 [Erythranthe tilingii]
MVSLVWFGLQAIIRECRFIRLHGWMRSKMKIASSKQRLSYCLWRCMQKQDDFMPMRITKILYEASAQQIADHMWKEFPNSCYGYKKVPLDMMCPLDEMTFYESDHYHPLAYAKRNGVCLQKDYPYTGVFQKDHVIPQEEARRAIDNGHLVIARIRCFSSFNNFIGKRVYMKDPYERNMEEYVHFVVIIGYVKEGRDDYYIVQNSWGKDWSDEGKAKVAASQLDPKTYVKGVYVEKAKKVVQSPEAASETNEEVQSPDAAGKKRKTKATAQPQQPSCKKPRL